MARLKRRNSHVDAEPVRHLLVRLPNPLGDVVMATPALRALRRALPAARITWSGRPAALKALEGLRERDDVAALPFELEGGLLAPWRTGTAWRLLEPDAVLLLPHSMSSAIAARFSGAGRRTGWARHGRGLLLTEKVELELEGDHLVPRSMVVMYLDLCAPYGAVDDGSGPRVVSTAFDRRRAARRLDGIEGPVLAVNPGAAFGASKIYPPAQLARAVGLVRKRTGLLPLLLCGPGEEHLARETAAHLREPLLSTHEVPPDLGELKALLERSAVLLTTDAGPRHLARALEVPAVVIMGPTDPRWTAGDGAVVVRKEDLDCLSCHKEICPVDHACMADLDPSLVAEAVVRIVPTA